MNSTQDSCRLIQEEYPDLADIAWIQFIFGVVYSSVLILGVIGNCFTGYCIVRLSVNVGIKDAFVLSLTFSNLLICLVCLPVTGFQTFAREWLLPAILCIVAPFFQAVGIFVCSFTLAAIAIDRYIQISRMDPNPRPVPRWKYPFWVGFLWIMAFASALPYAWNMEVTPYSDNVTVLCGVFCGETWPDVWGKAYGGLTMSIQFLLPLTVLAFCYWQLAKKVKKSVRRRMAYQLTEDVRERLESRQKKTSTMMWLLVAAFVVPWLPYNLLSLFRDFHIIPEEYISVVFATIFLAAMTSTFWNPVIYCWLNPEFQAVVTKLCKFRSENSKRAEIEILTIDPNRNIPCIQNTTAL